MPLRSASATGEAPAEALASREPAVARCRYARDPAAAGGQPTRSERHDVRVAIAYDGANIAHVNPAAPTDDYPEVLEAALRAYLSGGWDAGATALEPIAGRIWTERVARARVVNPPRAEEARSPEGSRRSTQVLPALWDR